MTRSRDVSAVQNNLGVAIPPAAAGKNAAINGGQDIWQRGTSFTTTAAYTYCSDRWYYSRSAGNTTVSRQTDAPTGFSYSIRLARNSGDTNTSGFTFHTALETADSLKFAGQPVTFSFWAKCGANYSATTIATYINTGTGTDQAASGQNAGTWTGFTSPLNGSTFTPTTSWVKYSFTATIGSTATQIGMGFITSTFSGTAGANDWVQFTGLQFELGSSATPFSRAGGTIQGELSACQRYYWRSVPGDAYAQHGSGWIYNSTQANILMYAPVPMRIAPTSIDTPTISQLAMWDWSNTDLVLSALALERTGNTILSLKATISGATGGRGAWLRNYGTATTYIGFNAEL